MTTGNTNPVWQASRYCRQSGTVKMVNSPCEYAPKTSAILSGIRPIAILLQYCTAITSKRIRDNELVKFIYHTGITQ